MGGAYKHGVLVTKTPLVIILRPHFRVKGVNISPAVLAHVVSEDGDRVSREHLEALIMECDSGPSPCSAQLDSLFKEKFCSIESFQRWVLANPDMASFSRWLLVEESPGMDLEGEADSLTFYQTLSQWYKGEWVGPKQDWRGCGGCGLLREVARALGSHLLLAVAVWLFAVAESLFFFMLFLKN